MDGRQEGDTGADPIDLAVVGAGPVGLETAAAAADAGLTAVVLERHDVGHHVLAWGHVRMFTDFGRNTGPAGRRALHGVELPEASAVLTGAEFHAAYLRPLAEALAGRVWIRENARVLDVSRDGLLKGDAIGDAARADTPFRLLVEHAGREEVVRARRVVDASGTFGSPNRAGRGGIPALGERSCAPRFAYTPPDVIGRDRAAFAGNRILLIGDGHSAATTAVALGELARAAPGTSFVWLTRKGGERPLEAIPDDPLPRRAELVRRANGIAGEGMVCDWQPASTLVSAHPDGAGVRAAWRNGGGAREATFARVVANVGYEPDERIYRQLQIHECYATRGPMRLSAVLLAAAGDGPADCLAPAEIGADTLANPEPGFFILGMKSYGKNGAFLLERGYHQVAAVMGGLAPSGPG